MPCDQLKAQGVVEVCSSNTSAIRAAAAIHRRLCEWPRDGTRRYSTRKRNMDRDTRRGTWVNGIHGFILACISMLVLGAGLAGPARAQVAPGCTASGACVSAGPRLASVDSTQGPLLNLLLQSLLPGTNVTLSVLDWNALANADINLNALLIELGADADLSDASQVLDSDITLGQLQLAMVNVLAADGETLAANALQLLPLNVAGLVGTIKLGDLLQVDLPQGSLADVDLDVLDLVTGAVQLYNYDNVLTTPSPVAVDTAALGLPGLASLQLWLQVVEPPVYECGEEGTGFHTAAIRVQLNVELVQGLDLAALTDLLDDLDIGGVLGVSNASVTASVLKLQVYADIARAEGTIGAIDQLSGAVTLNARPGLVNFYLGTIDDAVFFNRNQVLSVALLDPTTLTDLNVSVRLSLGPLPIADVQVPIAVQVEAAAEGSPYSLESLVFNPPYPQTQTLTCGTQCAGYFASTLLTNLDVTMVSGTPVVVLLGSIPLPLPINDIVNALTGALESTLDVAVPTLLSPILQTLLGLVDNLLGLL